jgi:MerR family transcriptional regulator, thiopeptide resistance regulator
MINKERWVEIMRAAGLNEKDMRNWHIQFEKMEPEAHQEFLESLGINATEIQQIREWSRKA